MRTGANCLKLAAVAALVLTVSAAWAQPQGQGRRGGFGFGRGFGGASDPTILLTQESVQKDLELTDDQKTKVTKLSEDNQQAMQDIRQSVNFQFGQPLSDQDQQTMRKKTEELAAQNKKKIADILVPQQQQRLDEIALQYSLEGQAFNVAGTASALAGEDLSKKLGLTDDQKKTLENLQAEAGTKMQDLMGGGGFPDQQEMAKLRTDFKDKAFAVLTADQKAKLDKMKGKPFDVSTIQLFGRGRGRGRGGPGGGAGGAGPGA